jgi:hypothetical protein
MLILYNNFFHSNLRILYDNEQDKVYTLIYKCGTQSLMELSKRNPLRFSVEETVGKSISNITVFLRDPFERWISGLITQTYVWHIDPINFIDLINKSGFHPIIDGHTSPQFWAILKYGLDNNVQFTFKDISEIAEVDSSILHLNINNNPDKDKLKLKLTSAAKKRVMHFLTEDVVLYNQFLNTTTTIDVIIDAIKKEENFVTNISQYKKAINYLF